jgi:5-methylcytosine-specific restriction endonuclease McrA
MSQWIRKNKWAALVERGHFHCAYCGEYMPQDWFTLDHIVPREQGGSNSPSNLVCCCNTCNKSKGTKPLITWLREQYGDDLAVKIRKEVRNQTRRRINIRPGLYLGLRYLWASYLQRQWRAA